MAKTPIGGAPKFAPQRRNDPKNSKKEGYPINGQIRAKEVRLVGDNVEQGVYTLHQALQIAENQDWILLRFLRMQSRQCAGCLTIRNFCISKRNG